jgi:hypothetical protein
MPRHPMEIKNGFLSCCDNSWVKLSEFSSIMAVEQGYIWRKEKDTPIYEIEIVTKNGSAFTYEMELTLDEANATVRSLIEIKAQDITQSGIVDSETLKNWIDNISYNIRQTMDQGIIKKLNEQLDVLLEEQRIRVHLVENPYET